MITQTIFSQTMVLNLWTGPVPGSKQDKSYQERTTQVDGLASIDQVTHPQLLVYLPPKSSTPATAVVIVPGGGYGRLAMSHEGKDIAAWLNSLGMAGIILKYRLPSDKIMKDKTIGPLQDAQEAIRTVRRKAAEWNINPARIGIMGFSAGGHLAATASTMYNEKTYTPKDETSARPDFSVLMYGVLSMQNTITHPGSQENLLGKNPSQELIDKFSNELHVSPQTPPSFLVHSEDDDVVKIQNSTNYYEALVKNKVPAELHLYQSGGHGYGLAKGHAGTETGWPEALVQWLRASSFLEPQGWRTAEKRRIIVDSLLKGIKVEKNIPYNVTGRPILLDVYYPGPKKPAKPAACVVWIHGGGLISPLLTKDYDFIRWGAARTARAGWISVSIDYRLVTESPLPAAIQDCQTAIRFLKSNASRFNIDTNRIAVVGESAGGYLAGFCSFAAGMDAFTIADWNTVSNTIACGVLWYPAISHPPYNMVEWIKPKGIPVLSIHGDFDKLVSIDCSHQIEKACKDKRSPFELVVFENTDHGFYPDVYNQDDHYDTYHRSMEKAIDLTIDFLNKHLQ